MDVGDQRQQRRHLLAALEDAELAAGLDLVDVVRRTRGDADDLRLRSLRLQHEGRQIGRRERRAHRAEHLAAELGHHGGGVLLQRMPERIIVGDEEPAVAAALDHLLRGADRQRAGVEHPLHRVGTAELAVEIRSAGGVGDEQLLLVVGDVLDRKTDRRHRHVDDEVDLLDVVPAPRDAGADIRLELMIADDHGDRLAQHLAAEIVDRHLRGGNGTLPGRRRRRPVHVGENADLDHVIRHLGERCRRRQQQCREGPERETCSGRHVLSPPMDRRRIGRILVGRRLFCFSSLLQLFIATRQLTAARPRSNPPRGNWLYISEFIQ